MDLAYSLDLDRAYANMRKREYAVAEDARNVRLWVCILGQDILWVKSRTKLTSIVTAA